MHGNLTSGGKPLLCSDPHLALLAPSLWLLFHLEVANGTQDGAPLSLIGTTFAGAPGIVIGRNQHIAWGVTNTGADVQDLFVLPANESDLPAGRSIISRVERFEIAGENPEYRTIRNVSGIGPIITDNGLQVSSHTLALKWVSIDPTVPDTTYEAFSLLNTATTFDEFRGALRRYVAPAQNFVFASATGDIGYQIPGKIPNRQDNITGLFPTPLVSVAPWPTYVAFDDLPFTKNPGSGFIATANNRAVPSCFKTQVTCDWDEGRCVERERASCINLQGCLPVDLCRRIPNPGPALRPGIVNVHVRPPTQVHQLNRTPTPCSFRALSPGP